MRDHAAKALDEPQQQQRQAHVARVRAGRDVARAHDAPVGGVGVALVERLQRPLERGLHRTAARAGRVPDEMNASRARRVAHGQLGRAWRKRGAPRNAAVATGATNDLVHQGVDFEVAALALNVGVPRDMEEEPAQALRAYLRVLAAALR